MKRDFNEACIAMILAFIIICGASFAARELVAPNAVELRIEALEQRVKGLEARYGSPFIQCVPNCVGGGK